MVLKGTVDNNIYQIAQRKLRLDKEVLEVSTQGLGQLKCTSQTVCHAAHAPECPLGCYGFCALQEVSSCIQGEPAIAIWQVYKEILVV